MLEDFLNLIQNGIGAKRLGNNGKGMIFRPLPFLISLA
jgi:hypothetical protein